MGRLSEIIKHPTYQVTLPTTQKPVTIRPWTYKEEVILLIAKESDLIKDKILAIQQIVNNCIVGKAPKSLPIVDTDYLFLKIREKSVGAIIPVQVIVNNKQYKAQVNLSELAVKVDPNHKSSINLDENTICTMNYLSYNDTLLAVDAATPEFKDKASYDAIKKSINLIVTPSNTYTFKDYSPEEQEEFLQSLRSEQLDKLKTFFITQPKLIYNIQYEAEDGTIRNHEVDKIKDFF